MAKKPLISNQRFDNVKIILENFNLYPYLEFPALKAGLEGHLPVNQISSQ